MIYTFLIYSLPFVLLLWLTVKLASVFLGLYVMSFGNTDQQEMASKNASASYRLGLMFAVMRSHAAPRSQDAPVSPTLKAAMDELETLKVERETIEVRREIEALRASPKAPAALPAAAVTLPVVAAVAVPSLSAASQQDAIEEIAPAQEVAEVAVVGERDELVELVPPADEFSPVVRDPESGDLVPV